MNRFFNAAFFSFTIWISAIVAFDLLLALSGILYDTLLKLSAEVVLLTALFSLPGIFIFWLIFLVFYHEPLLLRILMKTALLTSAITSALLLWLAGVLREGWWLVPLAIMAALMAVMGHYRWIRSALKQSKKVSYV